MTYKYSDAPCWYKPNARVRTQYKEKNGYKKPNNEKKTITEKKGGNIR